MRLAAAIALAGLAIAPLQAEVPKVDALFPAGGQRGTEIELTAIGKLEPWPPKVWISSGGLELRPHETQKGRFVAVLAADAEPGPRLLRFHNPEGCSVPRLFIIGDVPEIGEAEPNDEWSKPQAIALDQLPVLVNGKFDKGGDVDGFGFQLAAGQRVVADVSAYAMDSPLDPLLHVRDATGRQLAFNHDASTIGLDPRLDFVAPTDGRYLFQLSAFAHPPKSSIKFAGGESSVYRIKFSSEAPALAQVEPHPDKPVVTPFRHHGRIEVAGEVDRFTLAATKGQLFRIELHAAVLGSLLDGVLRIHGSDDKMVAESDDIDGKTLHDAALDWTAPADGMFSILVFNRNAAGGERHGYRIEITEPVAGFIGSTASHAAMVKAGEKAEIVVSVARKYGYKGNLHLQADSLPDGVSAAPVEVPEKAGDLTFIVEAAPEAAVFSGLLKLVLKPAGDAPAEAVKVKLKGTNADAGDLLINELDAIWLTVTR